MPDTETAVPTGVLELDFSVTVTVLLVSEDAAEGTEGAEEGTDCAFGATAFPLPCPVEERPVSNALRRDIVSGVGDFKKWR